MASCMRLLPPYLPLQSYTSLLCASSCTRMHLLPVLSTCKQPGLVCAASRHALDSYKEGPGPRNASRQSAVPAPSSKQSRPTADLFPSRQRLREPVQHNESQQHTDRQQARKQEGAQPPKKAPQVMDATAAAAFEAEYQQALQAAQASVQQQQQLEAYLDFMLETNKVMNLTAVRNRSEALVRHLADSLALLPIIEHHYSHSAYPPPRTHSKQQHKAAASHPSSATAREGSGRQQQQQQQQQQLPDRHVSTASSSTVAVADGHIEPTTMKLIDVGTGAGLPGMVLAIMRPHWQVTLLDSLRKRCDFLARATEVAGVRNVRVEWCRAEDGGRQPNLRDAFDVSVARAVAETRVLAELCLPFVRSGGLWIAAKGPDPQREVATASKALQQLQGKLVCVSEVASASAEGPRTAVVVHKHGTTPSKYPRAPGTPSKLPL